MSGSKINSKKQNNNKTTEKSISPKKSIKPLLSSQAA
jgi:hypothetical protein